MGEGEREKEKKSVDAGEKKRKGFGSSFYMFFPPPGPALCKLGLARSSACSEEGNGIPLLVFRPSFALPCLSATAILDSFSLFYLPNNLILKYLCTFSIS